MWTIRIDKASPSQNEFAFANWRVAHRSKSEWAILIRCGKGYLDVPKAIGKRHLTIVRHGERPLDVPNLIGGAKGIIDNLVQFGLLVDDRPELLDITARNHPLSKGEKPYTELILEDAA